MIDFQLSFHQLLDDPCGPRIKGWIFGRRIDLQKVRYPLELVVFWVLDCRMLFGMVFDRACSFRFIASPTVGSTTKPLQLIA